MNQAWPWLALVALGMFHGVNPAMGWLFAVGLGMHRGSRAVVLWALLPLALGHAIAVGVVVAVVTAIGVAADASVLALAQLPRFRERSSDISLSYVAVE
jgi:hypothetical protein